MSIQNQKLLYHLTTLDSFESIAKYGLLSRKDLEKFGISFVDTANHDILKGRERLDLSGYIPFHFHIHSSYDTAVKNGNDNKFIYIRLNRDYAIKNNFMILPIHPTSLEQPQIYNYDDGFKKIDWNVMEMTKEEALQKGYSERYHRNVRMAECLSPFSIQVQNFQSIIVENSVDEKTVLSILGKYNIPICPPFVDVDTNSIYFG